MTVRINKPALNLREELTKAQSVVPYVQQQFWMDGLVENGTFDTGTEGWNLGTDWGYDSVNKRIYRTGTTYHNLLMTSLYSKLVVGKRYVLKVEVGGNTVGIYTEAGNPQNIPIGVNSIEFTYKGNNYPFFYTSSASLWIDNVAVFEVDENDNVIHSLPLGWKPLHVYEDGLIQREGDVHDYTVVKTGGAYAIKPAVQPTATTETCVIAEREL